jgi:ABC-type Fe3+-siderophore transport system permease subunit
MSVNWLINIIINIPTNIIDRIPKASIPILYVVLAKVLAVILAAFISSERFNIIEQRKPTSRERDIITLSAGTINAILVIIFGLLAVFGFSKGESNATPEIYALAGGYMGIIVAGYISLFVFLSIKIREFA